METKCYRFEFEPKSEDFDRSAHLNNASYLKAFELARWGMIQDNGFDGQKLVQTTQIAPVILEVNLKFKKEVLPDQRVSILTRYTQFRSRVVCLEQTMLVNHVECCVALFTFGLFSLTSRKMVSPAAPWTLALGFGEHFCEAQP